MNNLKGEFRFLISLSDDEEAEIFYKNKDNLVNVLNSNQFNDMKCIRIHFQSYRKIYFLLMKILFPT